MSYHEQPHTLDPSIKIEGDAPLAQGHDEDRAADVKEASEAFAETVKAEQGQDEVTARAPGDHAEKQTKKSKDA